MKNKASNIWAGFVFELEATYGYNLIEVIAGFLLFVCITLAKNATSISLGIWIPSDPTWDAAEAYEHYNELLGEAAVRVYSTSAFGLSVIVAFVLPVLVMFSIARGFEDGSLQTHLSYPIGRSRLLLTKVNAALGMFGLMTSMSMCLAVSILSPGVPRVEHVLLILSSLWAFMLLVITSSALIALLVKRSLVGVLVGVAFWLGIGVMGVLPDIFTPLENLLNPMSRINDFFNFSWMTEVLFTELAMNVIGTIALALSLLMICIVYFEQVEV